MRILNLDLYSEPVPAGRSADGRHVALGQFDLECERGIIARRLMLVRDAVGARAIWSKRHSGFPAIEFAPAGRDTVLALVDAYTQTHGQAAA